MRFLIGYLALGVLVLAANYVYHRLSRTPESKFKDDLMSGIRPETDKFIDKIITYLIAPIVAVTFLLIAWPLAIYYEVKGKFSKSTDMQRDQPKEFSVSRNDLIQQFSVEEIEWKERVLDPLKAVPDLPFGHLNKAWNRFLEQSGQDDVVWTFSANWTSEWGRKELRAGYVLVRPDSVGPYFLTTWQNID